MMETIFSMIVWFIIIFMPLHYLYMNRKSSIEFKRGVAAFNMRYTLLKMNFLGASSSRLWRKKK